MDKMKDVFLKSEHDSQWTLAPTELFINDVFFLVWNNFPALNHTYMGSVLSHVDDMECDELFPYTFRCPGCCKEKMFMIMHIRRPFSLPAWLVFHFVILSLRPHLLVPILSQWCHQIRNPSAKPLWCNHLLTPHQLILKSLSQVFGGCFQVKVQHFLWNSAMLGHNHLQGSVLLHKVSQSPDDRLLSFHD